MAEGPLRTIHVIPNLALGGAQRVMIEVIRQLLPSGIGARIVVLDGEESAVEWPSLPVEPVFLGYGGSLRDVRGRRRAIGQLRRILREEQTDVIHSHLWGAATVAGEAIRGSHVPHVVHVHDTRPWVRSRRIQDAVRRWWTRKCLAGDLTSFVAVSQDAWSYNSVPLGITNREFTVIPNGVNTEEFCPADNRRAAPASGDVVRIGVVARFNPEKGHAVLIRAAAQLLDEGVPLELHLAGTGSLLEQTGSLAEELCITDSVHFHGMTTDVPAYLQTLDIFVLPSLACEGMPLSILEAMAVGLPVIATDVGGTSEVVLHESNGLLVPPGDVAALADALRILVDDPQLRDRLSAAANALIHKRHTWSIASREIENRYRAICRQIP